MRAEKGKKKEPAVLDHKNLGKAEPEQRPGMK